MADVPAAAEVPKASTEDRLAALFGGGAPAPVPAEESGEPAQAAEQEETEVVATDAEDEAPEQTEDAEPFEELEHLGKTYEVPVSLKKAFEENRAMATRTAQTAKQAEALLQHATAQSQLVQAEAQFAQYAKPEMTEKAQLNAVIGQYRNAIADPSLDRDLRMDYLSKMEAYKVQLSQVEEKLGEKQKQYDNWRAQQRQQILQSGQEYLMKVIPGITNDQTKLSIAQQAAALGYTKDEISNFEDPRLVVALHKAAQWDRLQSQKPGATAKVTKAPPVAKPGSNSAQNNSAVVKLKAQRARLKQSGDYRDAVSLLEKLM